MLFNKKMKFSANTLLIIAIILSVGSVSAYQLSVSHWSVNTTYSFSVGSNFSDGGVYNYAVAADHWNGTVYAQKMVFANSGSRHTRINNPDYSINGVNEMLKGNYGQTFLAETVKYSYSNTPNIVFEADMKVNSYYAFTNDIPCYSTSYALRSVLTHEFGHIAGLDHEGYVDLYTKPVMYAYFDEGEDREILTYDDKNGYAAVNW